ncbi:hypothetical protein GQX73_g8188 [Xylaria multiplex]|uniref:Uncharacterized protein n=1 Tax=Xylaria multiplex TaxID=323545 RepID=A0A7C8IP07_9PEZI|nr:hypothetical protein GQX73_g8188 [Xylaria multiplex]
MRPSSFFSVLMVAVSSLPISQFNAPLTGILPDLLQNANGLLGGLGGLGGLLGHNDHKEPGLLSGLLSGLLPNLLPNSLLTSLPTSLPNSLPCLFDNTFCAGSCTSNCLREPQTCLSCMSSCLTRTSCSANNGEENMDDEGEQDYANRAAKAVENGTVEETAANSTTKVSASPKSSSSPDLSK